MPLLEEFLVGAVSVNKDERHGADENQGIPSERNASQLRFSNESLAQMTITASRKATGFDLQSISRDGWPAFAHADGKAV